MRAIGLCIIVLAAAFAAAMWADDTGAEYKAAAMAEAQPAHPQMYLSMHWRDAAALREPDTTIFTGFDGAADVREPYDAASVETRIEERNLDRGFYLVYQPASDDPPQYVRFAGNGHLVGFQLVPRRD